MDISIPHLRAFCAVVETGSFTRAGEKIRVSKVQVSRLVRALEERIGIQLLLRTTRSLSVTDSGDTYYQEARRILEALDQLEYDITAKFEDPSGQLRLALPKIATNMVCQLVEAFRKNHPRITFELLIDDRPEDLVQRGIDLAFRIGTWADSNLRTRTLGKMSFNFYASPTYISKHGIPEDAGELAHHHGLWCTSEGLIAKWNLPTREVESAIPFNPVFTSNDASSVVAAAVNGMGILQAPDLFVAPKLDEGSLVHIRPELTTRTSNVRLVYPLRNPLPARVELFLDFVCSHARSWWLRES